MQPPAPEQLHRVDPLTGCGNLLAFLDWMARQAEQMPMARSLIAVDINFFADLNRTRGQAQGDAALRWVALVLAEETSAPIYRTGGDEFTIVVAGGTLADNADVARRVFARLNHDADKVDLRQPAATVAIIHCGADTPLSPGNVMIYIQSALIEVKQNRGRTMGHFHCADLAAPVDARHILDHLISQMVDLGAQLDESRRLALSDPVTGLPKSRAAVQRIEAALAQSKAANRPLALLMVDGDNLRRFNDHGYAAGDKMIRDLAQTLTDQLRPGDFIARWRVGDEFVVLLPNTPLDGALAVGERLAEAVREASQTWLHPVTISMGVTAYPAHGATKTGLLAHAESAKDQAKALGKNRVIAANL